MCIISICFSGNCLLQTFGLLFADNEGALNSTWHLTVDKEVLVNILGDFFIMVVENFFLLSTFFRETRFFRVVVIKFTFSNRLHFSRTTVEIYVRVAAGLVL